MYLEVKGVLPNCVTNRAGLAAPVPAKLVPVKLVPAKAGNGERGYAGSCAWTAALGRGFVSSTCLRYQKWMKGRLAPDVIPAKAGIQNREHRHNL